MRRTLIAANWKMNEPPVGCCTPDSPYRSTEHTDVWVFPTFIDLHSLHAHGLITGAQCGHPAVVGAFTGDVSMQMLAHQRVHAVLCGHSERRKYHGETNEQIAAQAAAAVAAGMHPIICVGESREEREHEEVYAVLTTQLTTVLGAIFPPNELPSLTPAFSIAYEPVWAIGTGQNASPEQAQDAHALLRAILPVSQQFAIRILYGGSVQPSNAPALIAQDDIDGFLIGGASLDPVQFKQIIDHCNP